jgi:hypothetical protein
MHNYKSKFRTFLNGDIEHLNRTTALALMHEIYDTCKESIIINYVSFDKKKTHFQINIKCDLDNSTRQHLKTIVEKYQLAMKEEKGYVQIF